MMDVAGKAVAIVGRAAGLATSGQGAEIDGADFVVRVNWRLPVPVSLHAHAGSRTDLLYTLRRDGSEELIDLAVRHGVNAHRLDARLRREIADAVSPDYLPNTGTVAIIDALRSGAKEVRAYGFDLHTSTRYADTGQVVDRRAMWSARADPGLTKRNHDPDRDGEIMRRLLETEPRFRPDPTLRKVLEGIHV